MKDTRSGSRAVFRQGGGGDAPAARQPAGRGRRRGHGLHPRAQPGRPGSREPRGRPMGAPEPRVAFDASAAFAGPTSAWLCRQQRLVRGESGTWHGFRPGIGGTKSRLTRFPLESRTRIMRLQVPIEQRQKEAPRVRTLAIILASMIFYPHLPVAQQPAYRGNGRTKLGLLSEQCDVLLVEGSSEIGRMPAIRGSAIRLHCRECRNLSSGQREIGLTAEVFDAAHNHAARGTGPGLAAARHLLSGLARLPVAKAIRVR